MLLLEDSWLSVAFNNSLIFSLKQKLESIFMYWEQKTAQIEDLELYFGPFHLHSSLVVCHSRYDIRGSFLPSLSFLSLASLSLKLLSKLSVCFRLVDMSFSLPSRLTYIYVFFSRSFLTLMFCLFASPNCLPVLCHDECLSCLGVKEVNNPRYISFTVSYFLHP